MKERPVYRPLITPWYDSTFVCRILFWLLVPVVIFAFFGILEALEAPDWKTHIWMPLVLGLLSLFLIVRLAVRLGRRRKPGDEG